MDFKRKIYDKLLAWKGEDKKNSVLLIEGARRIVKTTIVKEFGEKNTTTTFILISLTPPMKSKRCSSV